MRKPLVDSGAGRIVRLLKRRRNPPWRIRVAAAVTSHLLDGIIVPPKNRHPIYVVEERSKRLIANDTSQMMARPGIARSSSPMFPNQYHFRRVLVLTFA